MISTKTHLPRRTFLRGAGTVVALPLLDAMVPAFAATRTTAARPVRRLGAFYVPNGVIMKDWTPTAEGTAFEVPSILQPIASYRDSMLVLSGLSNQVADIAHDGGAAHTRASAAFLTGCNAKRTEGAGDLQLGVSMDQIAAKELGKETQIGSLQLTCEANDSLGTCETGYSCAYRNFSWISPTTPLPMEVNPRALFERLFGDSSSTDPRVRLAEAKQKGSILDSLVDEASSLQTALGPNDRRKLTEYFDAVRDAEQRIQSVERQNHELPTVAQPAGVPGTFSEHARLMFDLLSLAFQSDITRVFTMMLATESSDRPYPECGVPDPYHAVTHHGEDPVKIAKCARVNTFHIETLAYFLDKLRSVADGDGSLLDHSILMYGSGMSDGSRHNHDHVPLVVLAGKTGHIRGGRHLRYPQDTPLSNLHVSVLNDLGVAVDRLGDSTGDLSNL